MIDVARVRADTPGCRDVAHFNNAGAALPTRAVLDTVIEHLELEARVGGYMAADLVAERSAARSWPTRSTPPGPSTCAPS